MLTMQRTLQLTADLCSGEMQTAAFSSENEGVLVSALKLPQTRWQCYVYVVDGPAKEIGRFELTDLSVEELSVETAMLLESKIPGWVLDTPSHHLRAVK